MIDLRMSGIFAAAAFLLSFLLGLLSGAAITILLGRALIFAIVFFVISVLIKYLVTRFLPELLERAAPEDGFFTTGTRVDITEGDTIGMAGEPASMQAREVYMGAQPDDSEEDLGDISDLMTVGSAAHQKYRETPAGMDQDIQDGYNEVGEMTSFSDLGISSVPSQNTPQFRDYGTEGGGDLEETLPDLDSMAGAFSTRQAEEDPDNTEYSRSSPPRKRSSMPSKEAAWAGDFNAKEMAKGLQTILSKDKEG